MVCNCANEDADRNDNSNIYSTSGNNKNKTMPETRCNIEAIAIGGKESVVKARLIGLLDFTIKSILIIIYEPRISVYHKA